MKVLVDTSIWSLAFRRKKIDLKKTEKHELQELIHLINETLVVLIGPVKQEILSGITIELQFEELKNKLSAFEDYPIKSEVYEMAAKFYNLCRKKGIQGSQIDFLICAVAANNKFPIFTKDKDFLSYAKVLNINLHAVRKNL